MSKCRRCNGTGVVYVDDGIDDVNPEICDHKRPFQPKDNPCRDTKVMAPQDDLRKRVMGRILFGDNAPWYDN